jgi:hypothetical protein
VCQHLLPVDGHQGEELAPGGDGLLRGGRDPVEEEVEPPLPVAVDPDGVQTAVVLGPVPLEEEAEVQEWLA